MRAQAAIVSSILIVTFFMLQLHEFTDLVFP
jgi:hypothetical protein